MSTASCVKSLIEKPAPADVSWSVLQKVPIEAEVTIEFANRLDAVVNFDMAGTYVLQLTADDGMAENSDTVTIIVKMPTCEDVINDGLLLIGDFSGPEDKPDCKVDLYDLAIFVSNWMVCNDPSIPGCRFPY